MRELVFSPACAGCDFAHVENMAQNIVNISENSETFKNKVELILKDRKNLNFIIDIIQGLLSDSENDVTEAVECLVNVFHELLFRSNIWPPLNEPQESQTDQNADETYKLWLLEQYSETKTQLLDLLGHQNSNIQKSSALALLSFLFKEYDKLKESNKYPSTFLKEIVSHLLNKECNTKHAIMAITSPSLLGIHRLHILQAIHSNLKETKSQKSELYLLNVYAFLQFNWIPKKTSKGQNSVHVAEVSHTKKIKVYYSEVWVQFLKSQIPFSIYKRVLVDLYEKVLPNMKKPLVFTDFLTESYNYGGAVSLLALNGLFYLIQNYNLEYSNFYEKLYTLLSKDIFHAKYRPRFFYLMDLFLSSTHLPAYLVAAFVKKLSHLSLAAPPDVILIILPFVRNLLVRHPNLKVLVHRSEPVEVACDPFLSCELDPAKCKAMESSLWEIKSLQNHWHPYVSKEAHFVDKSLPSMEKDMSEIFETKYSELFNEEVNRELKDVPLSYEIPKGLFNRSEDKMVGMWTL